MGSFLGIEWSVWKLVGWAGNGIFCSRFIVQWYHTEKRKEVVMPAAFWWLSLAGSLILLAYGLFHNRDSVYIFAYGFTWIPYIRNLMIHHRQKRLLVACGSCSTHSPPRARFCHSCGASLPARETSPNV
jgi:lipid-A-disaccharide synthase-like uncharacterized protein